MKIMSMAVVAAMCVSSLFAADVNHLKGLGRGVQNIKYENGVISTLMVVGHKAVPVALRRNPGRAAKYAGDGAREEAQLEFTRFLSTKCKWGKTASGETAVKEEAASATDAQGAETSSESSSFTETEMSKEQKEQSAQACVSGIQVIWEGMNDSGEYVWVGGWNAKAAASIKGMAKTMNEANAEVSDMGDAAKKQRDAENKKKLDETNGASNEAAGGAAGAGAGAQQPKKPGALDILGDMKKPEGTIAGDAKEFGL